MRKKKDRFSGLLKMLIAVFFIYAAIVLLINVVYTRTQFTNITSILGTVVYDSGFEESGQGQIDITDIAVYGLLGIFIVILIIFVIQRMTGSEDQYETLKQKWKS